MLPGPTVALVLTLIERWRGGRGADWRRNIEAWGVYFAATVLLLPLLHGWRGAALLDGARMPFVIGFVLFLVVKDFGEYAYHRAQHVVPWLWAMHSLHHSDPAMAALTTQRHFWGDQLLKQVTVWAFPLMLIRPTTAMLGAYGVCSLWNFVVHADLPLDFGRCSWLLNSPAYHRRHHSALPEHYDSNFAALFPIFDVICGSYHRPEGRPPTGLPRQPRGWGELVIWPLVWNQAGLAARLLSPPSPATGNHL